MRYWEREVGEEMKVPVLGVVTPKRTLKKIGSQRFWPTPWRGEITEMPWAVSVASGPMPIVCYHPILTNKSGSLAYQTP